MPAAAIATTWHKRELAGAALVSSPLDRVAGKISPVRRIENTAAFNLYVSVLGHNNTDGAICDEVNSDRAGIVVDCHHRLIICQLCHSVMVFFHRGTNLISDGNIKVQSWKRLGCMLFASNY